MPALFAYLIAVGLLLGGGYGALNWLAAPEPVKVAAKARPTPPPPYPGGSAPAFPKAITPSRADASASDESEQAKQARTASDAAGALPERNPPPAANGQTAAAEASAPAQVQQIRDANAEAPPADDQPEAKPAQTQPAKAAAPVSPSSAPSAASNASAPAAKTMKRPHPARQASRHSDRRGLALMTLRTIEFPDGRRVSHLIPYRGGEPYRGGDRALAFQPDE
jgi:hypothetical protein